MPRRTLNNSMTLYDLIEELIEIRNNLQEQGLNDDIPVVSSSDYGDNSHTEQLSEIQSIEIITPGTTAYSQSGYCYRTHDDGDESQIIKKVVVLRYQ